MNILHDIPLLERNTYRIGGKSLYYAEPGSSDNFKELQDYALEHELPVFILGKGSNVLISDHGWPGLTINTSFNFSGLSWDNNSVVAEGGGFIECIDQPVDCSWIFRDGAAQWYSGDCWGGGYHECRSI
ncbi:MAG TPA: hypothetical protein VHO70_09205 [Chitinispirillaceae bacterium]|nr:hypothetical protein [Chitinispirillaceae bacterium]